MLHVSHSIAGFTLKIWAALNRNGPGSEQALQVASAAVGDFLNLTALEKAGGDSHTKGVGILSLASGQNDMTGFSGQNLIYLFFVTIFSLRGVE